jgi:hypothetical protein
MTSASTADTTRAVAQLLYSNTFARTPDVKYVFSHAGGTVPFLAGRFAIIDEMGTATKLIPRLASLESESRTRAS